MANAAARIEHVYSTPIETHNPMEPARHDRGVGRARQVEALRCDAGRFLRSRAGGDCAWTAPDNVRVISRFLGGGFGSKGPTWSHVVLAAMAARQVNRPVKLVVERPQMFGPVGWRPRTRQTITAGASSDECCWR